MNHVQDLLDKQNIRYFEKGNDFVISCLNPEHPDNNPSMRIDKITGMTHCFGCGFKPNLFRHFGIVDNFTSIKTAKLKEKLKDLYINFNGVEFPCETLAYNKSVRGITLKTLKEFGAFYTHDKEELVDRIWFPITDTRGKTVVFVGRHTLSDGNPRYLNYPKGVTMPLFPQTFTQKYKSVVLVEGIFDMLNVRDKGIENVCCTFGTNTLHSNTGVKLLPFKVLGINKIYLMFDGDVAGKSAMDKLQPLIEAEGFTVEQIILEDDTDPGDMSQEYIDSIREYING